MPNNSVNYRESLQQVSKNLRWDSLLYRATHVSLRVIHSMMKFIAVRREDLTTSCRDPVVDDPVLIRALSTEALKVPPSIFSLKSL